MFINAIPILIFFLLHLINAQVIEEDPSTESLVKPHVEQNIYKQKCPCLNNGECYFLFSESSSADNKKQVFCRCPNFFIGKICEIEAFELSTTKEIQQKINIHNYKYFYYEPIQQNMYSFKLDLCLETKTTLKALEDKSQNDTFTLFLSTQNEDGGLMIDEEINKPISITVQPDQCKTITVDYTVLLITKVKTIQKLVLAIKLGQKVSTDSVKPDKDKDKTIEKQALKQNEKIKEVQKQIKKEDKEKDKIKDRTVQTPIGKSEKNSLTSSQILPIKQPKIVIDYHPISYTIESSKKKPSVQKEQEVAKKQNLKNMNNFKSKSPSKLNESDDMSISRGIIINFSSYPFMVEFVVFNILFSLTTLAAFMIIGVMIFIIRSRILGIRISRSLCISSRLINDLRHFDRYVPAEKYIKKERKSGNISPNSSEIECAICLVKFENMELIRRMYCSHSFHKGCIDRWCHENLTCPMCRKSLTQKNMAQYYNSTALEIKNSPESDE